MGVRDDAIGQNTEVQVSEDGGKTWQGVIYGWYTPERATAMAEHYAGEFNNRTRPRPYLYRTIRGH